MKKIFSILVAGLLCTSLSAQVLDEGFEGEQFAPEGWTTIANHSYPSFSSWSRAVKSSENPKMTTNSGQACAFVNPMEGADNWLITPQLRPEADEILLFSARVSEYAKGAELQVLLSTTGTNVEDFTIELGALPTSQSAGDPRLFKEWRTYQFPMEDFVGQRVYIAFRQYDQSSAEKIYLDDIKGVTIASSASCSAPFSLRVTAISANSASFAWESEAESEYQYCCVPAGAGADWTGAPKISEKKVTVSDLAENAEYDFYVRAYCSDEEQSLAPKASFSTICIPNAVPWAEDFAGHPVSSGWDLVTPDCWVIASENPQVAVVASKNYDDEGDGEVIANTEHLLVTGGNEHNEQVFALPAFNLPLNTLEVAFDYRHSYPTADYGTLEIGSITNPSNAKTFVALKSLPLVGSDTHHVETLNALPADAQFIAFRYAGATSNLGSVHMDNFVVAEIGKSDDVLPQGLNLLQNGKAQPAKRIVNGALIIEHNGLRYNAQGALVK